MTNPINNAVTIVPRHKLVVCKRCGCGELAWVQSKQTSRWYLVHTSVTRPFYRGENQAPQAPQGSVYAVKTAAHDCKRYEERQAGFVAAQSAVLTAQELAEIHRNAAEPSKILTAAVTHLWETRNVAGRLLDVDTDAVIILGAALSSVAK